MVEKCVDCSLETDALVGRGHLGRSPRGRRWPGYEGMDRSHGQTGASEPTPKMRPRYEFFFSKLTPL
jgi:hypothetical protein